MNTAPSTPPSPPFLACMREEANIEVARQFARMHGWPEACVHSGDIVTATKLLAQGECPPLILVEVGNADEAKTQLDALANVVNPDTKVIAAGLVNEYSFFCWLTEIGVSGYLLLPLSISALEGAYGKASAPTASHLHGPEHPSAQLIGVLGTRGGVGATSLTILSAAVIAQTGKRTALVDLDPQDGSLALLLDVEPSRGLREALERPDRIDGLFLDRAMQKINDHLWVLSGEESLTERIQYHDQAAEALLRELQRSFDVVVFDISRRLNPFTRSCLQACNAVYVVTEMTLQGLRDTMRYTELMAGALSVPAPTLVVNRLGLYPKLEIKQPEFEKAAGRAIAHKIPFSAETFSGMEGALPILKNANAPILQSVRAMLRPMFPDAFTENVSKSAPKTSWWGKRRADKE